MTCLFFSAEFNFYAFPNVFLEEDIFFSQSQTGPSFLADQ